MKTRLLLLVATGMMLMQGCKQPQCPEPERILEPTDGAVLASFTANLKMTAANGKDANVCDHISLSANNYSIQPYLLAQSWTNGGLNQDQFMLLDFDLSSIPSNAVITEAKLNLYSDTSHTINGSPGKGHYQTGGINDAYLRRITSPWVESTVSWNTKPSTDNVGQLTIPSTTSNDQALSLDVTALVKDEHANESSYHGFMIGMNDLSPYRQIAFYSSDCAFPALTPELKVTYSVEQ